MTLITLKLRHVLTSFCCIFQALYGRFGLRPDKYRIQLYERYVLGNRVFRELTYTQLFQVTVSRSVLCREYLLNFLLHVYSDPKRSFREVLRWFKSFSCLSKAVVSSVALKGVQKFVLATTHFS